jgi:hypothetical protein
MFRNGEKTNGPVWQYLKIAGSQFRHITGPWGWCCRRCFSWLAKDCALKYATITSLQILNHFRVITVFHFIRCHVIYVGERVTLNLLKLRCSNVNFLYLHVQRVVLEKNEICDISWRHNLLVYQFVEIKSAKYESRRFGSGIKGSSPLFH